MGAEVSEPVVARDRPRRLVVVAGVGTEVGKTRVAAALAARLVAEGWRVAARKPAQSGEPPDEAAALDDASVLAAATGEAPPVVCPPHRRYSVPMAPPMAAEALGQPVPTIAELAAEVAASWPPLAVDVGLVELAGGVASPHGADGDGAELAAAIGPDAVVVVADAGLGTINAVRLSAERIAGVAGLAPIVVLNRFDDGDDLHRRNRRWLADRDGYDVVVGVAGLAERVLALRPAHCGSCGRPLTHCDGGCARPLDPERFCERCGRRLVVRVSPASVTARCKVHGTVG